MYTFPELIKKIRNEAGLNQAEFADALDVSAVLVAMIETEQKDVSKKFILKLADRMNVHPASITPFLFVDRDHLDKEPLGNIEKMLLEYGEKMQSLLIGDKAKKLRKYANVDIS